MSKDKNWSEEEKRTVLTSLVSEALVLHERSIRPDNPNTYNKSFNQSTGDVHNNMFKSIITSTVNSILIIMQSVKSRH
jgi:hypothetical protein